MKPSPSTLAVIALSLVVAGCGASVTPALANDDAGAPAADAPVVVTPASVQTCEAVRAACGSEPQQVVRGHAAGLAGLDGARVRFAVRYARAEGQGLGDPYAVVVGAGEVRGGAFETCVCLPRGGLAYPQIAAVVFAPGTAGETSRDVARAMFSQRYATLGDEDVAFALNGVPSAARTEAALAALVDRSRSLLVTGFDGAALQGVTVFGGVVAAERPVAAEVATASISFGAATLRWNMPGRAWPTERVALVVDRNADRRCDAGDLAAIVTAGPAEQIDLADVPWAQGAALRDICQGLSLGADRGD